MSRGSPALPRRRRPGPATQLVSVLAALAALLLGAAAPAAAAAVPALPYPVQVEIHGLRPLVVRPGQSLTLSGTLRNSGAVDISNLSVQLRLSPTRLVSRAELDLVARQTVGIREGYPVAGTQVRLPGKLAAGQARNWSLRAPVGRLGLGGFGVYVVGVEVQGSAGTGLVARQGVSKTFLPWDPPRSPQQVRLGLVWPLTDRPVRDSQGVFTDDHLAQELRPGGRLDTLLQAAAQAPLARATLLLDGDLLASVAAMKAGYRVRAPTPDEGAAAPGTAAAAPEKSVAGTGTQDAARWLDRLRATVRDGAAVVALPYGDVDVTALARAGRGSDIGQALHYGTDTVSALLGQPFRADVAWPVRGLADTRTLAALRGHGIRTVVLSERALQLADPSVTYTPSARTSVPSAGGPLRALTTDTTLGEVLAAGASRPLDGPAASTSESTAATDVALAQRFLAETAMVAAERPDEVRTVVAAPPRQWHPDATLTRRLLRGIGVAPWLRPVDLRAAADTVASTLPRNGLTYPPRASLRELPGSYLQRVAGTERSAHRFLSILTDPGAYTSRVDVPAALLRAESTAWRGHRRARNAFRNEVAVDLREQRRRVHIISRGVTLSSRTGTIPVTVANDLDQAVVVGLSLRPRNTSRLEVRPPPAVRIEAGRKATIPVPARAVANGIVVVDTQLRAADGSPYGVARPIEVRATNYGAFAVVVVGAAGGLLFLTAGLQIARRVRAHRRSRDRPGGGSPAPAGEKVGA